MLIFSWSYAALLRPDGALLAVVLWIALIVYGRRSLGWASAFRLAVLAGLLSLLPFVAWTVRNEHTFHVFQPLAPRYANDPGEFAFPGFVRWIRTLTADFTSTNEIYWNGNSDRIDPRNLPSRAFDNPGQYRQTQRLLEQYNATTTLTPELDAAFAQLAAERVRAHPIRYYVGLPLLRLADMWLRPRVETLNSVPLRWWQYAQHPAATRVALFYGALNLAYLVAAFLGVLRRPPLAGSMVGFIALRSLLLATLEAPEPRYTLECFPVLIVLAAVDFSAAARLRLLDYAIGARRRLDCENIVRDGLVVANVLVGGRPFVSAGLVEDLLVADSLGGIDPDGHMGEHLQDFLLQRDQVKLDHRDSVHLLGAQQAYLPIGLQIGAAAAEAKGQKALQLGVVGARLQDSQLLDCRFIKLDFRAVENHDLGCVFPVVLLDVSGRPGDALFALKINGARLDIVFLHDCLVLVPGEVRLRAGELGCGRI